VTAVILLALALGGLAAGILVGRYYVPDDRALKRTARHAQAYVKTINLLLARDRDAAVEELKGVVEENVSDVEPYFALGSLFRNRGEWERAIRVHQAIAMREGTESKLGLRAHYQLGLDFRAAGMPRRATRAMEVCIADDPSQVGALRALSGLYEEQGRFVEAAETWRRIQKIDGKGDRRRAHHLLCAAAQRAIESNDLPSAKRLLKEAQGIEAESAHLAVASAELSAAKGDWKGVVARLREALVMHPDMVSYLAEPLRAAELELQPSTSDDSPEDGATRSAIALIEGVGDDRGYDPLLALAAAEMRVQVHDDDAQEGLHRLTERNPQLLPARVAAARLALASGDSGQVNRELAALVGEEGVLESALEGSWRCARCNHASEFFYWRCPSCRDWGSMQRDMGGPAHLSVQARRERRSERRSASMLLSGDSLPKAALESGLSSEELQVQAGHKDSAFGRAGKWLAGAVGTVRGTNSAPDDDLD
jgi:lipopolysaccharide biosynthesis regulator YciM